MKVFLSHSALDRALALRILDDLQKSGIEVWFDEKDLRPGISLVHEIQKGLETCDFILILFTRSSLASNWVEIEWKAAFSREIEAGRTILIPLNGDGCHLPLLLRDKLYVDMSINYQVGIKKLIEAVKGPHAEKLSVKRDSPAKGEWHSETSGIPIKKRINSSVIEIEGTAKTPMVRLNAITGRCSIKGRSIPENSMEFYRYLLQWFDHIEASAVATKFELDIRLEYFNTSSSKCILDVFKKLETLHARGIEAKVNWYHDGDDDDMRDAGKDYASILRVPFEVRAVETN